MTIHTRPEECLEQLSFEETLIRLYGREGKDRAHTRCLEAAAGFRQAFGYPAQALFSAPGRTELGGNHTDHQRGCVLAAAVDLDILAAAAVTGSGAIRVLSQGYPMTEVSLRELTPQAGEKNTSAALIRGVASRMQEMGCDLRGRGLDVYMTSTVPKGSGLSSSAAFEVLMGTMLNELFWAGHCTPVELAQIGQYAENMFFGKPCGLMDQTASSVGGVVAIDFADTTHPVVERLDGGDVLESLTVRNVKTGQRQVISAGEGQDMLGLFGFTGHLPDTELLAGQLELDRGYIPTDEAMATAIPGVFAVSYTHLTLPTNSRV